MTELELQRDLINPWSCRLQTCVGSGPGLGSGTGTGPGSVLFAPGLSVALSDTVDSCPLVGLIINWTQTGLTNTTTRCARTLPGIFAV